MRVLGVDPGAFGAFALIEKLPNLRPTISVFDMPTVLTRIGKSDRPRVDLDGCFALCEALGSLEPDFAVLEKVQGFGGQNAAAAFVFGSAARAAEAAVLHAKIPRRFVSPEKWKKELGIATDKQAALVEVARIFPEFLHLFRPVRGELLKEVAIGRAEAGLIAYYGLTKLVAHA